MKITIQCEDETEARVIMDGMRWARVVWDINEEIRQRLKYHELHEMADAALDDLRDFLHHAIDTHGVSLDELP